MPARPGSTLDNGAPVAFARRGGIESMTIGAPPRRGHVWQIIAHMALFAIETAVPGRDRVVGCIGNRCGCICDLGFFFVVHDDSILQVLVVLCIAVRAVDGLCFLLSVGCEEWRGVLLNSIVFVDRTFFPFHFATLFNR